MQEKELDGFVVTSNENVFYTTGLPVTRGHVNPILFALWNQFPSYSVLDKEGMPSLVTWGGALGGHEFWVENVRSAWMRGGTTDEAVDLVNETLKGARRVGIESDAPYEFVGRIKRALPGAELVASDEVFTDLRSAKSPEELEMMKGALEITEKTVGRLQEEMDSRVTTHGLITRAKVLLYEHGATGVDHATMALGTANPEIPDDVAAKNGDLAILDIGAILNGYVSDSRRLAMIGRVPSEIRDLNAAMASIVTETGNSARPGMTFAELCEVADTKHSQYKVEPMFFSAGHTIGIQTEELWMTRESQRKFEDGMVFNIELYSRTESNLIIGTEDTFVVTNHGVEQLTRLPHDIYEVVR
jgi:Xaa-Pro aminopeptidase